MANPMRTLLWVPGNIPRKIAEALECQADCIVLDLEDTVPMANKPEARELAVRTIGHALAARETDRGTRQLLAIALRNG